MQHESLYTGPSISTDSERVDFIICGFQHTNLGPSWTLQTQLEIHFGWVQRLIREAGCGFPGPKMPYTNVNLGFRWKPEVAFFAQNWYSESLGSHVQITLLDLTRVQLWLCSEGPGSSGLGEGWNWQCWPTLNPIPFPGLQSQTMRFPRIALTVSLAQIWSVPLSRLEHNMRWENKYSLTPRRPAACSVQDLDTVWVVWPSCTSTA